jgi:inorganic pyrophosphatase
VSAGPIARAGHPIERPSMNLESIGLHPDHPAMAWAVVEQSRGLEARMSFDASKGGFFDTGFRSLVHARGFTGVYGWIGGTGVPPGPHFDVLVLTGQDIPVGGVIECHICGVFIRGDGDHKFVAVDTMMASALERIDLFHLPADRLEEIRRLYPRIDAGEGWLGADAAQAWLGTREPTHD